MKEYHAHQILTDYLEKKGFKVTRHAYGMETAFTAEFTRGQGRRIGFCSEYDGLPGLGQGITLQGIHMYGSIFLILLFFRLWTQLHRHCRCCSSYWCQGSFRKWQGIWKSDALWYTSRR